MADPILRLAHVDAGYGPALVVSGASVEVRPGSFVGLIGPNGSGKSTLLRAAAGVLRPRRGRVELAGRDVVGLDRAHVAKRVALAPQDAPLPPTFTAGEIVLMGRTPHLGWLAGEGPTDPTRAAGR